jgi:hypothetical protein
MRWMMMLLCCVAIACAEEKSDFHWVTSAPNKQFLATPRRASADWAKRSGAVSLNQAWEKDPSKPWYVELQREGGRWVEVGLAHNDEACIGWGLQQLAWGFAQMKEDGSFACGDPFHSASFLVESAARSLLLLRGSKYEKTFQQRIDLLQPQLLTCARWLASPVNQKAAEKQRMYTHRRFLLGCALEQTAVLHKDEALLRTAVNFVSDGLSLQREDGAFPEKGGHDSSYHAVALIYLQRFLFLTQDKELRARCEHAADRGVVWLRSRIDAQGIVSVEGNTRTGREQEVGRSGALKKVNLPEVATSLFLHAYRRDNQESAEVARKVLTHR